MRINMIRFRPKITMRSTASSRARSSRSRGASRTSKPRDLVPLKPAIAESGLSWSRPADDRSGLRGHGRDASQTRGFSFAATRRSRAPWCPGAGWRCSAGSRFPHGSGSGRRQLADWLTAAGNPLAARVMVNRIWQYHFGRGLVRNAERLRHAAASRRPIPSCSTGWPPSSSSRAGGSSRCTDSSCSPMPISAPARQPRQPRHDVDPENHLYWRFERRRLSAEELRDSLLEACGQLDRTPGGPHPFPPENSWSFTQHNPFSARLRNETTRRLPDGAAKSARSVPDAVRWRRPQCHHAAAPGDHGPHPGSLCLERPVLPRAVGTYSPTDCWPNPTKPIASTLAFRSGLSAAADGRGTGSSQAIPGGLRP